MKRLTVGLAVLLSGYAANSLAALPGGTSRCDVSVPSYCGGFTFGLTGLYWRPSSPQLDYLLSFPAFDTTGDFLFANGHHHSVDHDYDWGFKANIGYIFPCSGNDVTLTYTHWDNDDHEHRDNFAFGFPTTGSIFVGGDTFFAPFGAATFTGTVTVGAVATDLFAVTAPISVPFTAADLAAVSASSRFENNTWDLDFGQTINVGCNFKLRWFGGLRYSRLEHRLKVDSLFAIDDVAVSLDPVVVTATLTDSVGTLVGTSPALVSPVADVTATLRDIVHQKSEFDGIGPRFGCDVSYHLGGGFGVVGSLSTSLLVGEHEATLSERIETAGTVTFTVPGLTLVDIAPLFIGGALTNVTAEVVTAVAPTILDPLVETVSFRHPDETRVVPNIDAKLGLDWTYQFCNCSRSKLTIEAGYLVSHYFNAIDRLTAADAFNTGERHRETIDISFDGPYVGVQVQL